ncbi:MAG: hypothetical protein A2X32_05555 [Elusimicrobia bacterium GWC2_64_44]|nr:MAG: hypothetical protein A2X32_05555 [Elusimicrobia bacterium GWC2_64_44]
MKRLILPVFALLFPVIGLAESFHSHQFQEEDCCESLCPGAAATLRAADIVESFAEPQLTVSGFARVLPFFVPQTVEKDIFHPPLP